VKFRKKPVVLEAWQTYVGGALTQPQWLKDAIADGRVYYQGGDNPYWTIETLEGPMRANARDWIIQGVKGELYPCKPDIFEELYEPVSTPSNAGGRETP
jgi:hypothetical protein